MIFCYPAAVDDWIICPGMLTLNESEDDKFTGRFVENVDFTVELDRIKARGGKLTALVPSAVDISLITSESGAHDLVDAVVIEEKPDKTSLLVYDYQHRPGKLRLDALAAYLQHSLLFDITEIVLDGQQVVTLDELYVFGQRVTEAAAIALSIRGEAAVTSHLNPGRQCLRCLSAYRCPAYQALV